MNNLTSALLVTATVVIGSLSTPKPAEARASKSDCRFFATKIIEVYERSMEKYAQAKSAIKRGDIETAKILHEAGNVLGEIADDARAEYDKICN